jgi:hypothetical protein
LLAALVLLFAVLALLWVALRALLPVDDLLLLAAFADFFLLLVAGISSLPLLFRHANQKKFARYSLPHRGCPQWHLLSILVVDLSHCSQQ